MKKFFKLWHDKTTGKTEPKSVIVSVKTGSLYQSEYNPSGAAAQLQTNSGLSSKRRA
jgi:hypothetical protein